MLCPSMEEQREEESAKEGLQQRAYGRQHGSEEDEIKLLVQVKDNGRERSKKQADVGLSPGSPLLLCVDI